MTDILGMLTEVRGAYVAVIKSGKLAPRPGLRWDDQRHRWVKITKEEDPTSDSPLMKLQTTVADTYRVILKQGPPGPPPRPGLEWKEETSRWIRPKEGSAGSAGGAGRSQSGGQAPGGIGHWDELQWDKVDSLMQDQYSTEEIAQEMGVPESEVAEVAERINSGQAPWDTGIEVPTTPSQPSVSGQASSSDKIVGPGEVSDEFREILEQRIWDAGYAPMEGGDRDVFQNRYTEGIADISDFFTEEEYDEVAAAGWHG